MTLSKVSPGLSPAENFQLFEQAFDAIDALTAALPDLQQRIEAIAPELQRRIDAITPPLQQQIDAIAPSLRREIEAVAPPLRQQIDAIAPLLQRSVGDEATARAAGDAATARAAFALVFGRARPALAPTAFAFDAIGADHGLAPLRGSPIGSSPFGSAWRIDGAGVLARRAAIPVDPDAIVVLQVRYWRVADLDDPNNDAVDLGIQWLDAADGDAGTTLLFRDTNLTVQAGLRVRTFRVPSLAGDRPAIAAPDKAVTWRPFLQTYGAGGATALGLMDVRDATFAGVYAPDVTALASRLGMLEARLAAGLPLSAPILPAYAVADLPIPGRRGRKAFASDGRAPDAGGVLEAANAGTGVEVTDNGTAWVITGTNRQVQS